jgi:hypothetical protein
LRKIVMRSQENERSKSLPLIKVTSLGNDRMEIRDAAHALQRRRGGPSHQKAIAMTKALLCCWSCLRRGADEQERSRATAGLYSVGFTRLTSKGVRQWRVIHAACGREFWTRSPGASEALPFHR